MPVTNYGVAIQLTFLFSYYKMRLIDYTHTKMAPCETETETGLCTKTETSNMDILFFTHLKIVEKQAKITN